jgi:iron complex outermembrane recepter protein
LNLHATIATALALLLAAMPAAAQVPPDSTRPAPIPVRALSAQAARAVATAGGASALEVRLDSMQLPAAPTLEQVLRELPLVQVRTNSRGEAQFSLRGSGSDARQVAVLLDGVPLNLGWDDRADLSVLPATAATSLSLIRGLPSVLHGPNVLGGVLEVGVGHHPGRWMPERSRELTLGIESTGAYAAGASFAEPMPLGRGAFAIRAGAGYRDRPGFALPGDVRDAASRERADLRSNSDLLHRDGFLALRYLGDGGAWATLASSSFAAARGVPAELHTDAPRFWRYPHVSRSVAVVSGGTGDRDTPFGGRGDLEASIGVDVGRTEIVAYQDAGYADIRETEDADDLTLTLRLLGDHTLGGAGDLRGAFTFADISHDERLSAGGRSTYRQRIWSLGGEAGWSIGVPLDAWREVRLSTGAAIDGADTPESGGMPAVGALADWGARIGVSSTRSDGTLMLHAGLSRRARFPSLRELYSGALGRFEPNPALRPELLVAAEAGATARPSWGEAQLVLFHRGLRDAIERVALPGGRFRRVNVGESRSSGAELMLATAVGPVALSGDLTLQRVRLYEAGVRLPGHAEYQPDLLSGVNARLALPLELRVGAGVRHVGAQYCADPRAAGELRLPASTRLDVDAARAFRVRDAQSFAHLELSAALDNIGDAAIYDQCGLPQPGRTLRVQTRLR